MAHFEGSKLVLTENEMKEFQKNLAEDRDANLQFEALLAELNTMKVIKNEDGSISIGFSLDN